MALLRKFDEGGTTQDTEQQTEQTIAPPVTPPVESPVVQNVGPLTIQVYGEDYDVNALTKSIKAGIRPYLRSLKCKDKDKKFIEQKIYEIWDAMLEDVADGKRVTYKGTHFTDYKGILKNAPKEKNDFVGMAAWYIGNILDNATPVEKPKSYDYAPWLVGSVVLRRLFGTSAGDDVGAGSLQDWFLMDEPGEDNIRGTNNRAQRFRDVLQEILNDSHAFDEYNWSPENVQKARNAVQAALNAATQNGLDPTDYSVFATNLGRFGTGAQGWNTLFMGDTRTPAELAQEKEEQQKKQEEEQKIADQWLFIPDDDNPEGIRIQKGDSFEQNFNSWLNKKYPKNTNLNEITISKETSKKIGEKSNIITSILLRSNTNYISNALVKEMHGQASNLGNALRNAGIDRNIILPILIGWLYLFGNKEKINNDFWYLKDVVLPNNGVLFYNPTTGLVQSRSLHDVPSWMEARRNEFEDKLYQMGISINKQGGILTFKKGGEVGKYQTPANPLGLPEGGYEDIWKLLKKSRDPWFNAKTGEAYSKRLQHLYSENTGLIRKDRENDATNNEYPDTAEYDYGAGGTQIEGQDWWGNWGEILTGNKDLAEHWAREYAKYSPKSETTGKKYYAGWFDNDDFEKGKFNFEKFKESSNLWSDKKNSIGHDVYRAMVYAIKGPDGNITYYSGPLEGYENVGDLDTTHDLYDVQYLKKSAPASPPKSTNTTGTTNIGTGTGLGESNGEGPGDEENDPSKFREKYNRKDNSNKFVTQFGILGDYPANMVGATRLITHLRGNNKTADILSRYYRYTPFKKSPYYYAPVLGDLPAEQRAQREKGSLIYDAWRNLTSDASVNLANLLERYKLGMQKEDEGAEKNTARRRETAKEALAFAQKNIENNINTANDNTKERVQTLQYLGGIKASNKLKNVTAITNWLSEMQKNLHTRAEERIALTREANNMGAYMNYQDELQKLESPYIKTDGTMDYNRMYNDPKYINAVRYLKNKYQLALLQNAMKRGFRSSYTYFSKQGGKLIKRKRK